MVISTDVIIAGGHLGFFSRFCLVVVLPDLHSLVRSALSRLGFCATVASSSGMFL